MTAHFTRDSLDPALQLNTPRPHQDASRRASGKGGGHASAAHGRQLTTTTARMGSGLRQPRRFSSWTWPTTAALELSRCHPYGLALLDYKLQGMDSVEPHGRLRRVHAETAGVLGTSVAADASVHAASRRHPAGPVQAGGIRPPGPAHRGGPRGAPTLRHRSLAVRTGALQGVFLFCQARRGHASAQPGEFRASNLRPSGVG